MRVSCCQHLSSTAASAYMATPRVPAGAYVEKHAGILLGMLQAFTQSLPALPNTARGSGKHTVLHGQLQILECHEYWRPASYISQYCSACKPPTCFFPHTEGLYLSLSSDIGLPCTGAGVVSKVCQPPQVGAGQPQGEPSAGLRDQQCCLGTGVSMPLPAHLNDLVACFSCGQGYDL